MRSGLVEVTGFCFSGPFSFCGVITLVHGVKTRWKFSPGGTLPSVVSRF